jgi:hypothetical protein
MKRLLSALVGAALVLSMTAGAATASPSALVTLTIKTPSISSGAGTFVATGAALCRSGKTADVRHQDIEAGHFFVWKQFTCASPSSAKFVLKFDVHGSQPFTGAGSHDYGTWVVDSATDPSLRGSGLFLGTVYGKAPFGIVDRLVGGMSH